MHFLLRTRCRMLCLLSVAFLLPAAAIGGGEPTGGPIRVALIEGLSGAFANTGQATFRNMVWAVERVNQRGGIRLPDGLHPLVLTRYDNKGQVEESLGALRSAIDDGARFVMQGNSSAVALALVDAINKHNDREPGAAWSS